VADDDEKIILVMPLLREYYDPRFDTVGEVIEFFQQVFEVRKFCQCLRAMLSISSRTCNSSINTTLHIGELIVL
jgi:hypothetical protein